MMESLLIKETATTPGIRFEPQLGFFEISGKSDLNDPEEFYSPLMKYLLPYRENPRKQSIVKINLDSYSEPSLNKVFELLNIFEGIQSAKSKVYVYWCYASLDEKLKGILDNYENESGISIKTIEN